MKRFVFAACVGLIAAVGLAQAQLPQRRANNILNRRPGLTRAGAAAQQQEPTAEHWDPETTETVLIPVGGRDDTLAFRISGVSMEPALLDNDVILVEPVSSLDEIRDRRIVVVQLLDAAETAAAIGIDGAIVQDLGVLRLLRAAVPALPP